MGLDMYLARKTYVKNWNHTPREQLHDIRVMGPASEWVKTGRISFITEDVAYWRKFNALHNWMVTHAQNGVDDCREYEVSTAQLVQLRDLLDDLLRTKDDETVVDRFPTASGFFFGSTEYDDYYWANIKATYELLRDLLTEAASADPLDISYTYRASW